MFICLLCVKNKIHRRSQNHENDPPETNDFLLQNDLIYCSLTVNAQYLC